MTTTNEEKEETKIYNKGRTEEDEKRLADTNMENYGGEEHRKKQHEIALKQDEWKNAGKEFGIQVWRIEKFRVKHWPEAEYGTFYDGDSFIVLHTYPNPENETAKLFNVHFWLGEDTSQDEAGTAAIKTVELDDCLKDLPVQYREVQGHEGKKFKSLFPTMNILKGGVDSGFRKVTKKTYNPRLIHITGKPKKMANYEVNLSVENLNDNDAFILDHGNVIFQFRPPKCSVWEKQSSRDWVIETEDARKGGVKEKHVVNWDDTGAVADRFWAYFGGKPESLPTTSRAKAKKKKNEEMFKNHVNKIFHVTDENKEEVTVELKQEGVLDRSILAEEDDDVLIIDVGRVVFVWIGSTANRNEYKHAMQYATTYMRKNNRPNWIPVERVTSGREPSHFWKCFGCQHVASDIC